MLGAVDAVGGRITNSWGVLLSAVYTEGVFFLAVFFGVCQGLANPAALDGCVRPKRAELESHSQASFFYYSLAKGTRQDYNPVP